MLTSMAEYQQHDDDPEIHEETDTGRKPPVEAALLNQRGIATSADEMAVLVCKGRDIETQAGTRECTGPTDVRNN